MVQGLQEATIRFHESHSTIKKLYAEICDILFQLLREPPLFLLSAGNCKVGYPPPYAHEWHTKVLPGRITTLMELAKLDRWYTEHIKESQWKCTLLRKLRIAGKDNTKKILFQSKASTCYNHASSSWVRNNDWMRTLELSNITCTKTPCPFHGCKKYGAFCCYATKLGRFCDRKRHKLVQRED